MHTWGIEGIELETKPLESMPCKAEDIPDRLVDSKRQSLHSISSFDSQGNFLYEGIVGLKCLKDVGKSADISGNYDSF